MVMTVQRVYPVAHLPRVLGGLRRLDTAAVIESLIPPHPAQVLSCGHGVEALVLAILDGPQALYKGGTRLEERGMLPRLQTGLQRVSLHDDRLGQVLEALCAANRHRVCGAVALKALEVSAMPPPWLHQETTTMTL